MHDFKNFPSPHCHPQSLDSASTPEAFAKREVELGTGALTCTDHGTLGAAYKTFSLAKKNKLTPCIGLEGYFRDDSCSILQKNGIPKTNTVPRGTDKDLWLQTYPEGTFIDYMKYSHMTLGFRDYKSYLVGVNLLSKADERGEKHGSERKPLFAWNHIETLAANNVTLGSGCLVGMISHHLLNEDISLSKRVAIAKAYFDRLSSLFKDRFYIELFPHVCSHNYAKAIFVTVEGQRHPIKFHFDKKLKIDSVEMSASNLADSFSSEKHKYLISVCHYKKWEDYPEKLSIVSVEKRDGFIQNECSPASPNGDFQLGANKMMLAIAKQYRIPILVSDDSHFCTKDQKIVQDVRLSQFGPWKMYESYHRQTSEEAFLYFKQHMNIDEKTFESWVDNNYNWVSGFKGFEFDSQIRLPVKFYKDDSLGYTKELIKKQGRMVNDPRYKDRLKQEIELFHRNGTVDLLPYFWIDTVDACDIYNNQGKLTGPGRGSVGGVLLAYLLGITHVDPIKYGLSLDRFLTKDRIAAGKWPDVDQDLCSTDLLVGKECPVIKFVASDGTSHTLPEDFKIETDQGLLTVREALDRDANFDQWWQPEQKNRNP